MQSLKDVLGRCSGTGVYDISTNTLLALTTMAILSKGTNLEQLSAQEQEILQLFLSFAGIDPAQNRATLQYHCESFLRKNPITLPMRLALEAHINDAIATGGADTDYSALLGQVKATFHAPEIPPARSMHPTALLINEKREHK